MMVNGKKLPFSVSVTAETAVPAGQVDFNFPLKFSFYATHGYSFNFMSWKRTAFTVFKVLAYRWPLHFNVCASFGQGHHAG